MAGYVLLVEHPGAAAGLSRWLAQNDKSGEPFDEVRCASTLADALRLLDQDPQCSCVLFDAVAQNGADTAAIVALASHSAGVPVLAVCGESEHASGLSAVAAGAQDYVLRGTFDTQALQRALRDAGRRKRVEAAVVERALHDVQTGLPGRLLLLDRLSVAMKRCTRDGSSGTLLLVEIDHFDTFAELQGHVAHHAVLRAVAGRLSALVRASDTVARFAGGTFAVLLPHESGLLEALAVGEKLAEALGRPLGTDDREPAISATIGVARFRDASESAALLVERAEDAMRTLVNDGKGRVRLLDPAASR